MSKAIHSRADPHVVAQDPFLSPDEKLKALRAMVDDAPLSARGPDAVAVHRAIFYLYDRNPNDLKRHIYE